MYKENRKYNVKECEYEILDIITVCKICNCEIFNEEQDDKILRELNYKYRKDHNLLLPEDIKMIRKIYPLTQNEFSRLLGFGDLTISRYENGVIKDLSSNKLIELCRIPGNIHKLCNESKNISKSIKQKINQFINSIPTIFDIANMFILRFLENNEFLTNLKLQKLCYFYWADLITVNNKYLDIEFQAWKHGPVNSNLYHKYSSLGDKYIKANKSEIDEFEIRKFDDEALIIFENIIDIWEI